MSTSKNVYERPKVGGDILSYCGRCKVELLHTVVAMVDTQPVKVQCKSCSSQHKLRRTSGIAAKRTAKPRVPKTVVRVADLWEQKVSASIKEPVGYNVKAKYEKGDLIQHPKFGIGVVEVIVSEKKINVFFRDAERVLVHGM